ncbi:hypothetical protein [Bernardetia sp. MNP-M8]|uniref:hypothetical protein n=1 Tax=Bernardetia sp. MNP-M8 TaxID=3127470 RepID=UPI0030D1A724
MPHYSFNSTSKWLDKKNNQFHIISYNSQEATANEDYVIRDIEDGHFESIKKEAIKKIGHSNIKYVENSINIDYEEM